MEGEGISGVEGGQPFAVVDGVARGELNFVRAHADAEGLEVSKCLLGGAELGAGADEVG
jgi:hypothetical protein